MHHGVEAAKSGANSGRIRLSRPSKLDFRCSQREISENPPWILSTKCRATNAAKSCQIEVRAGLSLKRLPLDTIPIIDHGPGMVFLQAKLFRNYLLPA